MSDGLFPLGDDLSDEEEVEKVDLKKSVQKMLDREEKYRKKNEKKKEDYRKLVKQRRKEERQQRQDNGDSDAEEEDMEDVDNEDGQEVGTKRKMREEEDGENSGGKKAKTELGIAEAVTNGKESKKEREKKRKQEMKRRKRERQLAEKEREKELAARQDRILEQDMEVAARLGGDDQSAIPNNKKEKKKNKKKSVDEGPVSKTAKVVNDPAARVPAVDNLDAVLSKKKKKEKSKKERQETADATPPNQDVSAKQTSPEKKFEKKEKLAVVETVSNIEGKGSISKSEKKKKKREKAAAAVSDSSVGKKIASPTKAPVVPSPPADEKQKGGSSGKLFDELDDWDAPLLPGEQEIIIPNKKYKGAAKLTPADQSPEVAEHSPKSKKKKEKKNKEKKDNAADHSFSELSASPVPVSPATSGEVKSPPATPKGFPGFNSPTVSTPNLAKSHTAVFLKKALSKSATPKVKKSGSKAAKMEEIERSASEPRLKKVNFVLTRNKSQVIRKKKLNFFLYGYQVPLYETVLKNIWAPVLVPNNST